MNRKFTPSINDSKQLSVEALLTILLPDASIDIKLPSGKLVSKGDFISNSLFKLTKNAFSEIAFVSHLVSFESEYTTFLNNLMTVNWFEQIKVNPKKMAQFSIIAYLDEKIDQEELFVINVVAEGYASQSKGSSSIRGSKDTCFDYDEETIKVKPVLVAKDQLKDYLESFHFPPFAEFKTSHLLKKGKNDQDIEEIKETIIEEFGTRSFVKRTALEYTIAPFITSKQVDSDRRLLEQCSIEMSTYYTARSKLGFKDIEDGVRGTIVILPPLFTIKMFCQISLHKSRSDHFLTFGYSTDDSEFYKGIRVISIPSPAFKKLPFIHDHTYGPSGLSVLFHDLNYHIPLEVNNPHIDLLVEISRRLKFLDFEKDIFKQHMSWKQFSLRVASLIVDREANEYRLDEPEKAFWRFINNEANKMADHLNCFSKRQKFISWCNLVYYPIVKKVIEDQYPSDDARRQALFANAVYLK